MSAILTEAELREPDIFDLRAEKSAWNAAPRERWARYILPRNIPLLAAGDDAPVAGHGVYVLFSKDDVLLYIGKSKDIENRLGQHFVAARYGRGPEFAYFGCIAVPAVAYSDVEIAHIHALQPPLNELYEPPVWPGHAAMVADILEAWE